MPSRIPSESFAPSGDGFARSFGILSSFPPTACGIATFSAALAAGLVANGGTVDVVRCGTTPEMEDALVVASLEETTPSRVAEAIDALNDSDVAIIQHEYGLFAGADGDSVMSVRQIGEGHRSSIGFRTGLLDAAGEVSVDEPVPFTTAGTIGTSTLDADAFRGLAQGFHDDAEATSWVLDRLGEHFSIDQLGARLSQLEAQQDTRRNVGVTAGRLRALAGRT